MREKISVAMATYNGEKYIHEQLESILKCLGDDDEIIVSDDGSTDSTLKKVAEFGDPRIKLTEGPKKGVKKNFENAIRNCSGRYIFLSDQDDIWEPSKVEKVLEAFNADKCAVVVHNCELIDEDGGKLLDSYFAYRKSGSGRFKNFVKNSYMGCCMAFDATYKDKILPIPDDIEMHDQWIGLICERYGKAVFIDDILLKYRRHGNNASEVFTHYGLGRMIKNRLNLYKNLLKR